VGGATREDDEKTRGGKLGKGLVRRVTPSQLRGANRLEVKQKRYPSVHRKKECLGEKATRTLGYSFYAFSRSDRQSVGERAKGPPKRKRCGGIQGEWKKKKTECPGRKVLFRDDLGGRLRLKRL